MRVDSNSEGSTTPTGFGRNFVNPELRGPLIAPSGARAPTSGALLIGGGFY